MAELTDSPDSYKVVFKGGADIDPISGTELPFSLIKFKDAVGLPWQRLSFGFCYREYNILISSSLLWFIGWSYHNPQHVCAIDQIRLESCFGDDKWFLTMIRRDQWHTMIMFVHVKL